MSKRFRLLLIVVLVGVAFSFLWPTLRWYVTVPQIEKDLAAGSRTQIRLYAQRTAAQEYEQLVALEEDIRSIGPAPYVAKTEKGEPTELADATALDSYIEERGRKGTLISRYKGLGEMNAEELWETTMNPDGRTFLQVKIDDQVRADELFSVLMGDQVEPRRQFIEDNALNVRNLDV